MMPFSVCGVLTVVLTMMVSDAVTAQPSRWWKTEPARTELRLTAWQSTQIEDVFTKAIIALRQRKEELDRREDELSRLIGATAEEEEISRQIDLVEAVRASMNKTRTLMLLHMRHVLTSEQRTKLNALHEHWERQQWRQRYRDCSRVCLAATGARTARGSVRTNRFLAEGL